jgi:membrane protein
MAQRVRGAAARPVWIWPLLLAALATALLRPARQPAPAASPPATAPSFPGEAPDRVTHGDRDGREQQRPGPFERVLAKIPLGVALRDTALQWVEHGDARLGAALAYYSVFSLGPLIVIAVAIAGLILGSSAVRAQVIDALQGLLGQSGAQAIDMMLAAANKPQEGVLAAGIGIVTLVLAAIGVVTQLKDALNTVWETKPERKGGIWGFVRTYVLSLAGLLAVGFLLLVSMLLTAGLAAFGKVAGPYFPEAVATFGGSAISFLIISLLFAAMFKWLPDARVAWRDVWAGAILTAALFELGKFLIAFYIGKQGLESTYGAAASIVVVLVWVYYSAQILLFGAEFTNVMAKRRGSPARKVPAGNLPST